MSLVDVPDINFFDDDDFEPPRIIPVTANEPNSSFSVLTDTPPLPPPIPSRAEAIVRGSKVQEKSKGNAKDKSPFPGQPHSTMTTVCALIFVSLMAIFIYFIADAISRSVGDTGNDLDRGWKLICDPCSPRYRGCSGIKMKKKKKKCKTCQWTCQCSGSRQKCACKCKCKPGCPDCRCSMSSAAAVIGGRKAGATRGGKSKTGQQPRKGPVDPYALGWVHSKPVETLDRGVLPRFGTPDVTVTGPGGFVQWDATSLREKGWCLSEMKLVDEELYQPHPAAHCDFWYGSIDVEIPFEKLAEIMGISRSLSYDGLKKRLTARGHSLGSILAALYLSLKVLEEEELDLQKITREQLLKEYVESTMTPSFQPDHDRELLLHEQLCVLTQSFLPKYPQDHHGLCGSPSSGASSATGPST